MSSSNTEPFPPVSPGSKYIRTDSTQGSDARPQPRRKSTGLGGEPRGDTGVGALATLSTPSTASVQVGRTPSEKARPHSKRRKARSLLRRWFRLTLRHTWLNPLIILVVVLGLYSVNPTPANPLSSAIFLSYPLPRPAGASPDTPIQYGKGRADFAFVAFYTVFFSFTREFMMQRVLRPLAHSLGIRNRSKQSRFMEQVYTAIYFGIMGPFGLYVMSRTPVWYFNTRGMFENFPHYTHEALFKGYYLLQASYWAQQGLVLLLMLEKPRKDFKELVLHHAVTLALIWCSYRFHFTYMGIAVYITHDISDFFLATSKTLNYLNSSITEPYFIFFIGVWTYLRHYINLRILWAVLTEFRTIGPFELNWETQQYKCWISQYITFSLLAALQAVNMFWLFLIWRIAYRFITASQLADERSEDEEETEGEVAVTGSVKGEAGKEETIKVQPNGRIEGPTVLLNGAPVEEEAILIETDEAAKNTRRRKN